MLLNYYSTFSYLTITCLRGVIIAWVLLFSQQALPTEQSDDLQNAINAEQAQRYVDALSLYQLALKKARQTNQQQQQVEILYALIRVFQHLNQGREAFEIIKQLENLAVSIEDKSELVRIYRTLAIAYQSIGKHSFARDYFAVAVEMARELKNDDLLAQLLNEQAFLDTAIADYKSAFLSYEESLSLYKKLQHYSAAVDVSLNLIHAALKLKQRKKVLKLLNQLNDLIKNTKLKLTAEQWIRRGLIYRAAHITFNLPGRYRKYAFQSYQQVLNSDNNIHKANANGYIGQMYADEGRYDEAAIYSEKALSTLSASGHITLQYKWQLQLARVYSANKQISKSLAAYQNTLQAFKKLPFTDYIVRLHRFPLDVEPMFREYTQLVLEYSMGRSDKPEKIKGLKQALSLYHQLFQYEKKYYCHASCDVKITLKPKLNTKARAFISVFKIADGLLVIASINNQLYYHQVKITPMMLTQYLSDVKKDPKNIYHWMVKPFETIIENLKIKQLVFLDNRWLPIIPFQSMQKDKGYLIEDYAISVVTDVYVPEVERVKQPLLYVQIVDKVEAKKQTNKQIDLNQLKSSYAGIVDLAIPIIANEDYRDSYLKFTESPVKLTNSFYYKQNQDLDLIIARDPQPKNKLRLQQLSFSMISTPAYLIMNGKTDTHLKDQFISEFLSKLTSVHSYALAYQSASMKYIGKNDEFLTNTQLIYQSVD